MALVGGSTDLCFSSRDYRHLPLLRLSGGRRRLLSSGKHIINIKSETSTHSIHSGVSPIMERPLVWLGSRSGWLCDRAIPQAAIDFAGVRERRRLGPTCAACLRVRDTLRWHDTTKAGVHLTCTRDVREGLNKRKILGN
jgi:hypothetical protein